MFTNATDTRFQRLLLSMSFIDSSSSSVAVRQALYALTALHLYGPEVATYHKQKALQALSQTASLPYACAQKDRLQQIAAELLLTIFEMNDTSTGGHGWAVHTCNAKKAGNQAYSPGRACEGDARILLNWLFYHDALSRFSASHWAQTSPGMRDCTRDDHIRKAVRLSGDCSKVISTTGCSTEVLDLINSICGHVQDFKYGSVSNASEGMQALDRFERRLKYAEQNVSNSVMPNKPLRDADSVTKVAELYRLAGLIFLYRAGRGLAATAPKMKTATDMGFNILNSLDICNRSFPLTIIGCEARSDQERRVVLDLIARTRAAGNFDNPGVAHDFIESSWAQDDLGPKDKTEYLKKLDAIMSRSSTLPSFA